jgi:hypothetical protein
MQAFLSSHPIVHASPLHATQNSRLRVDGATTETTSGPPNKRTCQSADDSSLGDVIVGPCQHNADKIQIRVQVYKKKKDGQRAVSTT